ncbi:MAG: NHL repeat-containing protein [Armatimonadota bacterium]
MNATGKSVANWCYPTDEYILSLDVYADQKGGVYILTDKLGRSVQRFDSSGKFQSNLETQGVNISELTMFSTITIDKKGNIYIIEPVANSEVTEDEKRLSYKENKSPRILKFDSSGKFITSLVSGVNEDIYLYWVSAMAVDGKENIFVLDADGIKKYNPSGKLLLGIGIVAESGQEQFKSPKSIAVDQQGTIYVGDCNNYRIQKFNSSGKFVTQWNMK